MVLAVRACSTMAWASGEPPQAATALDHKSLAARSRAISGKNCPPTDMANWTERAATSGETPARSSPRRYATPVAMAQASSCTDVAPASA